ncbi:MAG TPA: MFS transporter [Sedimentibacter sp.]|nr:MFS transporter [Sedimentibacter sp.]
MDNKKLNIRLFYAIALLQGLVFYGPIATLYRQTQGLSVFDITLIESISLIIMIMLEIPWGYVSDKIGYKKTIIICNILYFISKIVFWKADAFSWFLAERLILSIVLSGLSGCDSAYLYLSVNEKDSKKVFSIYEAMSTTGLICASIIFSVIIRNDYRLAAFLTIISYGISMLLSLFLNEVKPMETHGTQFSKQIKDISRAIKQNKQFFMFLFAAALLAESNQTITVFLNQLQYLRSGIEPHYMGYIYILVTISGLLAAYSYRLSEYLGETTTVKLLFLVAGLSCTMLALSSIPIISVLGILVLRVSASTFVPIRKDIENRQVNVSCRATILSVYSSIMNAMAIGTNLIFGKMADISVKYSMASGALFCFIGLIVYSIWNQKLNSGR